VGGQQDEHVAAKNDVARLNGAQLADNHGVRQLYSCSTSPG
jgi:hypothetical protein